MDLATCSELLRNVSYVVHDSRVLCKVLFKSAKDSNMATRSAGSTVSASAECTGDKILVSFLLYFLC